MLVDSHCHLHLLKLDANSGDLDAVLERAKSAGVEHILCVCTELKEVPTILKIAERFEGVSASVGLHPSEKTEALPNVADFVALADHPKVVAIGETGLDYYYNKDNLDAMRERFRVQIRAAKEVGKPIIVHTRDAKEDTIQILREENAEQVGGVMHCFTEDWAMAEQALDLGFYISISGIVTFKKAEQVADVAKKVPLNRLLIETDAPFLTPVPFRGKPNEPQYVRYVAEKIAELRDLPVAQVMSETTANFYRFIGRSF